MAAPFDPVQVYRDDPTIANLLWATSTLFTSCFYAAFKFASVALSSIDGSWLIWGLYVTVHLIAFLLVLCVVLMPVVHGVWSRVVLVVIRYG